MSRKRTVVLSFIFLLLVGGSGYVFVIYNGGTSPYKVAPTGLFVYDFHSENSSVTIRHTGGEDFTPSPSATVTLEVYVFPVNESRPDRPRATIGLPFEEGDSVTISNVTEDDRVLLVWVRDTESYVVGNSSVELGAS
jgi:hypothetical protein